MAAESFSNGSAGVESLEARYRHLDDRVGRLSQEVAGISATLVQQTHTLETIAHRVNSPQQTQWASIIAGCAFVASLGYSALAPVQRQVEAHAEKIDVVFEQQRDVAAQLGEIRALKDASSREHHRTSAHIDALGVRTREADRAISGLESRVEAMQERLRDVDLSGSRKWIAPKD